MNKKFIFDTDFNWFESNIEKIRNATPKNNWYESLFNKYEKYQKQNLRIKKLKRILDE